MSVFVTGASGFIGRAAVRVLQERGWEPLALGRDLDRLPPGVARAQVDLATGAGLEKLPWQRCHGLVHLAASGVKASHRALSDCVEANVVGTQLLLDAISEHAKALPLVFGRTYYEDILSSMPAYRENAYVVSKAAATDLARNWARRHSAFRCVGARIFQVYGPGDDPQNVLPYVASRINAGKPALLASGRSEKDWIFVDDVAAALVAMLEGAQPGWTNWDAGSGRLTSVRTMVETLTDVAGCTRDLLQFDSARDRADTEVKVCASVSPSGWSVRVPLVEGLRQLWRSFT